jgi:hypothetical protein
MSLIPEADLGLIRYEDSEVASDEEGEEEDEEEDAADGAEEEDEEEAGQLQTHSKTPRILTTLNSRASHQEAQSRRRCGRACKEDQDR